MRTLNTKTLDEIEKYIKNYQKENGRSPSYRNIMHYMGMSTLSLVQKYVIGLERDGRIQRTRQGNIKLPARFDTGEVAIAPLVGQIACGEPCLEVENIEESFALPRSVFGSGELFMLRAFGESMIDAGINKGDLLVIRKQNEAENGDIVVALVNGENTLKRFYREKDKIILHPENKAMENIVVKNCEIQGVLIGCIKTY